MHRRAGLERISRIRMFTPRTVSRFGGAFWALVVAWLCAQSPQAAVFAVGEWVRGATHISHQDRLVAEVEAAISSSDEADVSVVSGAKSKEGSGKTMALVAGGLLEKLLLALAERDRLAGDGPAEVILERAEDWDFLAGREDEPLHPPPRAV